MNDIKQKLVEKIKQATFTPGQKKIAEYLVRNPEQISICSVKELAQKIEISDASLIRFSRSIGYKGYSDLKDDICYSLANVALGKNDDKMPLTERIIGKPSKNISLEYLKIAEMNLQQTFQQNSKEVLENAVNRILQAKNHYIIGFRGCVMAAEQMAYLLRFYVNHVQLITDSGPGGMDMIHDIGKNDVVVFFAVKRYYNSDQRIIKVAHQNKAKVCMIIDSITPPFAEYNDLILLAATKQVSFFNSMNSICALSECLISMIGRKKNSEYLKWTKNRDELTEDMRTL